MQAEQFIMRWSGMTDTKRSTISGSNIEEEDSGDGHQLGDKCHFFLCAIE